MTARELMIKELHDELNRRGIVENPSLVYRTLKKCEVQGYKTVKPSPVVKRQGVYHV